MCFNFSLVKCTTNCLYASLCDGQQRSAEATQQRLNVQNVSHASRTLIVLFEHVPFHRLENGLLTEIMNRLIPQPGMDNNPVVKIAILQLFAVIIAISPPHLEVRKINLVIHNFVHLNMSVNLIYSF